MPSDVTPYIQFFPSFRCNRQCPFCFNRELAPAGDMDVALFAEMVDILVPAGIREIDILGGEPTLHPGLGRMIRTAAGAGMKVSLSSNGSNPALLSRLSEDFGPGHLTIGVSLNDGRVSGELHRFICSTRPLLKGIASRRGFVTMTARHYLEETDIPYYALFMDTLSGEDLALSLSFPEYIRALDGLRRGFPHVQGVYCEGFLPDLAPHPELERARCPAGITKLSVTPEGDVYPCYLFFSRREYRMGNIFRDDLREIREAPSLKFFREFTGNRCPRTSCSLHRRCHGGCPAVSLLCVGDVTASDPRCRTG